LRTISLSAHGSELRSVAEGGFHGPLRTNPGSGRQLDEEIEEAIEVNAQQRSTTDFAEGVRAFLEQRKAEWPSLKHKA
jgi:aminoglycoside phosphotransferase (APT) family kinase protein